MRLQDLAVGMTITHPQYGEGIVQSISNVDASVLFGNVLQTVNPHLIEVAAPEVVTTNEAQAPSSKLTIEAAVEAILKRLGVEDPNAVVDELGSRWQKGKMVLHPADPTLQSKEIPLEIFFHKIVGVRNQLRVLEQKINSNEKLSDADKIDLQQYITRSYGSLTTFNLLFKNRDDQYSSKGD